MPRACRPRRIFFAYGLRNAVLPQVTALALSLGRIITGSVLVEMVFAYPGIGTLLFKSIKLSDFFTIYGCVLVLVVATGVSHDRRRPALSVARPARGGRA